MTFCSIYLKGKRQNRDDFSVANIDKRRKDVIYGNGMSEAWEQIKLCGPENSWQKNSSSNYIIFAKNKVRDKIFVITVKTIYKTNSVIVDNLWIVCL